MLLGNQNFSGNVAIDAANLTINNSSIVTANAGNISFNGAAIASGNLVNNGGVLQSTMGSLNLTSPSDLGFSIGVSGTYSGSGSINISSGTSTNQVAFAPGSIFTFAGETNVNTNTINIPATATLTAVTGNFNVNGLAGSGASNPLTVNNSGVLQNTTNDANSINITSAVNQGVTFGGLGGSIEAPTSGAINIGAPSGAVTFNNNTTLNGTINVGGGVAPAGFSTPFTMANSVTTSSGVTISNPSGNNLNVYTNAYHANGTTQPSLNLISLGNGTIFNESGNLTLSAGFTFTGGALTIASPGSITASGPITINLSSPNLTSNPGSLSIIAGFAISPTATASGTTTPDGGTFTFTGAANPLSNINLPSVTINTSNTKASGGGNGGNVLLIAGGSIDVATASGTSINTSSASGTAGDVTAIGRGITLGSINANGATTNAAGNINITAATPTINSALNGSAAVIDIAGSINPGSPVSAFSAGVAGGNISVAGFTGANVAGNNISLQAGAGTAFVGAAVSNFNSLQVASSSSTAFTVGSAATVNGIKGAISASATASDISLSNLAGGLTIANTISATSGEIDLSTGGSGAITFNAGGNISAGNSIVFTTGAGAITAASGVQIGTTNTTTGTISFNGGGNVGTTAPLSITAASVAANISGSASTVNISDSSSTSVSLTNVNLEPSSVGKSFTFATPAAITILGPITASAAGSSVSISTTANSSNIAINETFSPIAISASTVTVSANSSGTITDAASAGAIAGSTINFGTTAALASTNGSVGTLIKPVLVSGLGTGLTLSTNTSGLVNINNVGSVPLTLAAANTSSAHGFTLSSNSSITDKATGLTNAKTISLTTTSSIAGQNNISIGSTLGSKLNTSALSLTAAAGGNISTTSGAVLLNALNGGSSSVTLSSSSGNIGSSATPISVDTNQVSATSAGLSGTVVNVANTDATVGGTSVTGLSGGGSIIYKSDDSVNINTSISAGTSVAISAAGSTTFQSNANVYAANGAISVTDTASAATSIKLGSNDTFISQGLGSTAGGITLLVTNTKTPGTIAVGANSTLDSVVQTKSAVKSPFAGQISLVIGASVPSAPVLGTVPTSNVVLTENNHNVFYGSVGGGVSAASPNNTIGVVGNSAVVFVPAAAGSITLGGNDSIIADPPAAGSMQGALYSALGFSPAGTVNTSAHQFGTDAGTFAGFVNMPAQSAAGQLSSAASSSLLNITQPALQLTQPAAQVMQSVVQVKQAALQLNQPALQISQLNFSRELSSSAIGIQLGDLIDTDSEAGQLSYQPGEVLAMLASDRDLGLAGKDLDSSNGVEMDLQDLSASTIHGAAAAAAASSIHLKDGSPLVGNVSQLSSSLKVVTLRKGNVLFAPGANTLVRTPMGDVEISAKSLVLVMVLRDGLAVYDLDDLHKSAVVLKVSNSSIELAPGKHAFITRDSIKSFEQVNPALAVGYGSMAEYSLGSGLKAFLSEFSMPSAIASMRPLKLLLSSSNPEARRLAQHLLKTTAVTLQLKGSSIYQQKLPMPVTSMLLPAESSVVVELGSSVK